MQSKTMRIDRLETGSIEEAIEMLRHWTKTSGRYDHFKAWQIRDVIEHLLRPAAEQHAALAAAGLLIPPTRAAQKKRAVKPEL